MPAVDAGKAVFAHPIFSDVQPFRLKCSRNLNPISPTNFPGSISMMCKEQQFAGSSSAFGIQFRLDAGNISDMGWLKSGPTAGHPSKSSSEMHGFAAQPLHLDASRQ